MSTESVEDVSLLSITGLLIMMIGGRLAASGSGVPAKLTKLMISLVR